MILITPTKKLLKQIMHQVCEFQIVQKLVVARKLIVVQKLVVVRKMKLFLYKILNVMSKVKIIINKITLLIFMVIQLQIQDAVEILIV